MRKVLIFGGRGQLGTDCAVVLRGRCDVVPLDVQDLDVGDREECRAALDQHQPEVVVNCAAFTDVDACETQKEKAWRVNGDAPGFMAEWVESHRAHLVYVSTDYVFDGEKPLFEGYAEGDAPGPLSVYGSSKLEGERAVMERTGRYAILRTAWLYGATGRNFPKTMLRMAVREPARALRVVNDQFGSATWSYRLALQIERVIQEEATGIFHATAEGHCSWHDVARVFLAQMGVPHRIVPCGASEFPRPAKRPRNSILENARLKAEGWNVMQDWEQDLREFADKFRKELLEEAARG